MPTNPDHWLWRLTSQQWLAAAQHELDRGRDKLEQRRLCVTHLRRAAGMLLNSVLVAAHDAGDIDQETAQNQWGRSYLEHLSLLALADTPRWRLPSEVNELCRQLTEISPMPPAGLISLGREKTTPTRQALELVEKLFELAVVHLASS